ncbi:hypothetical protein [Ruegeria arenilitoris]|uniref:hypothetical protein n=1 Tax=Ruegeria arenilitoris TaxID=1173585 RepID=UPI00147D41DA|nr:hypothetical protein [Ruegeria arenilitoris]
MSDFKNSGGKTGSLRGSSLTEPRNSYAPQQCDPEDDTVKASITTVISHTYEGPGISEEDLRAVMGDEPPRPRRKRKKDK